ncbi:hypothetical protein MJD09_17155, partial [bacterium]|nr:hypothetical protein [bacterium]
TDNKMSSYFNVNYIPLTVLFDETGNIVRGPQYFNGNKTESYQEVGNWVQRGEAVLIQKSPSSNSPTIGFATAEAELRFRFAAELMRLDQKEGALHQLKMALEKSPDNLLILKQIWAIEHPERFYEGAVDFGWQREQFQRRGREQKAKSN